jgi:hypothetical protein
MNPNIALMLAQDHNLAHVREADHERLVRSLKAGTRPDRHRPSRLATWIRGVRNAAGHGRRAGAPGRHAQGEA